MKKQLSLYLLFALLIGCNGNSEKPELTEQLEVVNLIPYEEDELFGYKDVSGTVVLPPQYTIATDFEEGAGFVLEQHTGWRLIDAKGRPILAPFIFDNSPDEFHEGLARYVSNGKIGFYKIGGKKVTGADYDFALPFSEGLAAVCQGCYKEKMGEHYHMVGGKWGYVNHKGNVAIPAQYDEAESFGKGRAEVRKGSEWFLIDKNGVIQ